MKNLIKKFLNRETILYVLFGCLTTVVNYGVFWILLRIFGEDVTLLANVGAFVAAVIFAYVTNKLFVFESKSWSKAVLQKEIPSFLGMRLFSFALEEFGLWLCMLLDFEKRTFFGYNGILVAKLVLTMIVILLNYFFSKFVIFKKRNA